MTDPVRFPVTTPDPGATDVLKPTKDFLIGLRLQIDDEAAAKADINSEDVITAGALQVTKGVQKLIAWGGAGGAGAAIVGAILATYNDADAIVQLAFVLGAALIIFGAAVGLSRVMDGDVRGRSAVTVARLNAQSEVATEFLRALSDESSPASPPAADAAAQQEPAAVTQEQVLGALAAYPGLTVTTADGSDTVSGVQWSADQGLELRLTGGDRIKIDRVRGLRS